jgi:hypothetical protein
VAIDMNTLAAKELKAPRSWKAALLHVLVTTEMVWLFVRSV